MLRDSATHIHTLSSPLGPQRMPQVLEGKNLYFMPKRSSSLQPEKKVLSLSTMCVLLGEPDYEKVCDCNPDIRRHTPSYGLHHGISYLSR